MRRTLLLILLSLFSLSAWAQSEDWWIGKPIEDIHFNGLLSVSEYDLERNYSGIHRGRSLPILYPGNCKSKIFALDYFESYSLEAVEGSDGTNNRCY